MKAEKLTLLEGSRRNKPALAAQFAKLFDELGIQGEPIPARELRQLIEAEGIRPEDNEFSRGIIEMREE